MSSIRIRRVREEECTLWLEWRMRVLADVFCDEMPVDEAGLKYLRNANEAFFRRNTANGTLTSCFAEGAPDTAVGCGAFCTLHELPSPDNPSGLVAYIMNIYVVPTRRHMGIGAQIVEWLVDEAAARGIHRMMLETTKDARAIYARAGFTAASGYMIREEPYPENGR